MFSNLFDFSAERTGWQAFGFYCFYMFVIVVAVMLIGPLLDPGNLTDQELAREIENFQKTQQISDALAAYMRDISFFSSLITLAFGATVSVLIAMKKGIFREVKTLLTILATILLCYFLGPIIGFIPMAWLTTQPAAFDRDEEEPPVEHYGADDQDDDDGDRDR
tara:strand:- start:523 stop:1014 length:492 start_codon:yes stop_codon:yes gene_type:complete